jgi:hypothetical protein
MSHGQYQANDNTTVVSLERADPLHAVGPSIEILEDMKERCDNGEYKMAAESAFENLWSVSDPAKRLKPSEKGVWLHSRGDSDRTRTFSKEILESPERAALS